MFKGMRDSGTCLVQKKIAFRLNNTLNLTEVEINISLKYKHN